MDTSQIQGNNGEKQQQRRQLRYQTNIIVVSKQQANHSLALPQQFDRVKLSLPQLKKLEPTQVGYDPLTIKGNQVKKLPALNYERAIFERSNKKQFSVLETRLPLKKLDPLRRTPNEPDLGDDIIFAFRTKAGCTLNKKTKKNQDSCIVNPKTIELFGHRFFGICDGHGQNGHHISQLIQRQLPEYLGKEISSIKQIKECFLSAFQLMNQEVWNSQDIDCNFSGSTTASILIQKQTIWSANVGDSRAILCREKSNTEWEAIQLTIDHKPDVESEKDRILSCGGRIDTQRDLKGNKIGPLRVWLNKADGPGLAMTRSIGDKIGAEAGIISEPEIKEFQRTNEDRFIVIASDGVWEYLTNEDVMEIVSYFYKKNQIDSACDRIISEAVSAWRFVYLNG